MIRYSCPHCNERLQVDDAKAGKAYVCDLCGKTTLVPGGLPATSPGQEGAARQEFGQTPEPTTANSLAAAQARWSRISHANCQAHFGLRAVGGVALLALAIIYLGVMAAPKPEPPPPAFPYSNELRDYWDPEAEAFYLRGTDLARCFEVNEVSADLASKGQTFFVFGMITGIDQGALGGLYLTIDYDVTCHFDIGQEKEFIGLEPGQLTAVRGQMLSHMLGVSIEHCVIMARDSWTSAQ